VRAVWAGPRAVVREDERVKWARAVHHVESLAQACADLAGAETVIQPLRVRELWAAEAIIGPARDLDSVVVALAVDLPVEQVPWWGEPRGAQHWASAARMAKNPIRPWWRSVHAPIWNHRIVAPVLIWDEADGIRAGALAALVDGRGDTVGLAVASKEEFAVRMAGELAVSRSALTAATVRYAEKRWSPGRLDPLADELWRSADGYLDVLGAIPT
jgi:hypothetical protein